MKEKDQDSLPVISPPIFYVNKVNDEDEDEVDEEEEELSFETKDKVKAEKI